VRVLIVEDEADLAQVLRRTLEEEGHVCDWVDEGVSGLHQARHEAYDAIILDLMLPRLDGWTLLRTLRADGSRTPVLILSALDDLPDRVLGLDLGADDYLTKPFALDELLARLRALRRRSVSQPSPVLDLGGVQIDTTARSVRIDGLDVGLTGKEYALLELLASRRGTVVRRETIYEKLYTDDKETVSNVLDVYVANLRRKLGRNLIHTRRGQGYVIL